MKTKISGKEIAIEMKKVAKEWFKEYTKAGCIVVGVKLRSARINNKGRTEDGGVRDCYVGVSGKDGAKLLCESLHETGAIAEEINENNQEKVVNGWLQEMADGLVKYQSKSKGAAVQKKELWGVHNCAEAHLAAYLLKSGVTLSDVTIAAYEKRDGVQFKPLCSNCAQWVKQQFQILAQYKFDA